MATILDTHPFKQALLDARQEGFTLVRNTFSAEDIQPWEMVTRKYDEQHYCVIVFEDRASVEVERGIFPAEAPYKIEQVSAYHLRKYFAQMDHVSPDVLLIFLRDKNGQFAALNRQDVIVRP